MKKHDINIKLWIAIIAISGASLSLLAQSPQRQGKFQQKGQENLMMLNLTEDQKAEIHQIHLATLKKTQPLKDELAINKAKINALIKKDNPDMKEIVSLVEANGKIITQMQVQVIDSKIKVRALLDDEQKIAFDTHSGQMQRRNVITQHRSQQMPPRRNRF